MISLTFSDTTTGWGENTNNLQYSTDQLLHKDVASLLPIMISDCNRNDNAIKETFRNELFDFGSIL